MKIPAVALDKSKLLEQICTQLEQDLFALKEAARATYDAATNEESKPENEYDTRGLEASYLAGAQAKRVAEIEELLFTFRNTKLRSFEAKDKIATTALVEVSFIDTDKTFFVFIVPTGGGLHLQFQGQAVQTVSPQSPMGEALIGQVVGDTAVIEAGKKTREYEILSVF